MTRLLDWCFPTQRFVAHLEAEIADLRAQVRHERTRAEAAVNTLLSLKVGAPPITPSVLHEDPILAEARRLMEEEGAAFALAGKTA